MADPKEGALSAVVTPRADGKWGAIIRDTRGTIIPVIYTGTRAEVLEQCKIPIQVWDDVPAKVPVVIYAAPDPEAGHEAITVHRTAAHGAPIPH